MAIWIEVRAYGATRIRWIRPVPPRSLEAARATEAEPGSQPPNIGTWVRNSAGAGHVVGGAARLGARRRVPGRAGTGGTPRSRPRTRRWTSRTGAAGCGPSRCAGVLGVAGVGVQALLEDGGGVGGRGEAVLADALERVPHRRGEALGQPARGDRQREPGRVAQPQPRRRTGAGAGGRAAARRDRGRVVQPRVDEQRGLVQPRRLALQGPVGPLLAGPGRPGPDSGLVQVGDLARYLLGAGGVGALHPAQRRARRGRKNAKCTVTMTAMASQISATSQPKSPSLT